MHKDNFILTKAALMEELEKIGSSIEELEEQLKTKTAEEGVLAKLWDAGKPVVSHLAEQGPAALLGLGIGAGTLLGGTAYGIKNSLDAEDKEHNAHREAVDRYKQLTSRIKSDYNL